MPQKPWEKYAAQPSDKPWEKYGAVKIASSPVSPPPNPMGMANLELAKQGLSVSPPPSPSTFIKPEEVDYSKGKPFVPSLHSTVETIGTAEDIAKGLGGMGKQIVSAAGITPMLDNPIADIATQISQDPTVTGAGSALLGINKPAVEEASKSRDIAGLLHQTVAPIATVLAAGKMLKGISKEIPSNSSTANAIESAAPKTVNIEGVPIKVLAGEGGSSPESMAARMQVSAKHQGIRSVKFQQVEAEQQAAVRQVIQKVAQETVGDNFSPITESPADAVQTAADVAHTQARPMYQALDASISHVPTVLDSVNKVVQKAIGKARDLGYEAGSETNPDSIVARQTAENYGYKSFPDMAKALGEKAARNAVGDDIYDAGMGTSGQTPFTSYIQVRSQLLKMARSATDPAMKLRLNQIASDMNANIEATLKSSDIPGLNENWGQARRLWAKGYALRSIADSLRSATEGTPISEQHPSLQPQAPEVSGHRLVKELNSLAEERVLQKAFTPEEARSLRQVADILDRAQDVRIGQERLHISGYSPRSAAWHTVTDIVKTIGYMPIVKMMTEGGGPKTQALVRLLNSATPESARVAGARLLTLQPPPPPQK